MTICLRAYRVLYSKNGKRWTHRIRLKSTIKWKNDFSEIDVMNPEAWRNYLANDFIFNNGKKLPDVSPEGDPIVYKVYVFGSSKWMRELRGHNKGRDGALLNLFPAFDENGELLDVAEHGWLRKKC